jgi:hypothetical protein
MFRPAAEMNACVEGGDVDDELDVCATGGKGPKHSGSVLGIRLLIETGAFGTLPASEAGSQTSWSGRALRSLSFLSVRKLLK